MLKKLLLLCLGTMSIFALQAVSPVAHADGGAPNLAYVAGSSTGISVLDVAQQKVTSNFKVDGSPHALGLSLDARFLYVTQPADDHLAIIAAKTGEMICTADVPGNPSVLVVDTNTGLVYVGGNNASNVSVIDGTNCNIKRVLQTQGGVYGLGLAAVGSSLPNSSGSQIWVAAKNALQIFDGNSGKEIGKVTMDGPGYIAIPPGTTAYVTVREGGLVAVDLGSHKVVPLLAGGKYGPMDFDAATGEVYAPDEDGTQLDILTPVNIGTALPREPNRTINVGHKPAAIAITSDGQLGFVALQGGNVLMLDIPGRQSIMTYHVGGDPQAVLTGLYPPDLGTTPQQATIVTTVVNIVAYAFIFLLFVVPFFLFRRFSKSQRNKEGTTNPEKNLERGKGTVGKPK
jgi:hypothetical protein